MRASTNYQTALGRLREAVAALKPGSKIYGEIVAPRDLVLARYQPVFALDHLDVLTQEEFKSFLYIENNRHWSGLFRKGGRACRDMAKLRVALRLLLDDSHPIAKRIEEATGMVEGMGRALASAILLVVFPKKYGVWNNTSEGAMRKLGIWPKYEWGNSFGKKYEKLNQILLDLAQDLNVDMWTLDALWWFLRGGDVMPKDVSILQEQSVQSDVSDVLPTEAQRFALERHLQDFLLDNWDRTDLGKDWDIYSADGDDEAGFEFPTDVGQIDLLAKHRRESRWLVVELKRDQTSDATIGQLSRYMGWVKNKLSKPDEQVEGMVIAHKADESIRYALSVVPNVSLLLYQLEFRLTPAAKIGNR